MRVGVWLDEYIAKQIGGGFSYTERLVNLIDNYKFSEPIEIVFVSKKALSKTYKKERLVLEKPKFLQKKSLKTRLIKSIVNSSFHLKDIYNKSEKDTRAKSVSLHYKKQLIKHNIDVVYYLSQNKCAISDFPFISTNWDLGHLSTFAFPEMINNEDFEVRNNWYQKELKKALSIFVESESGKQELISFLNISPQRIKVLPMFAGAVVNENVSASKQDEILKSFQLKKETFFFYPAQFWAHKNHYNLLLAFKKFSDINNDIKLVFTGSDKGNLEYIKSKIKDLGLEDKVLYLDFVGLETLNALYKNAIALVMPTLLGPTNMPLLEARSLNCVVLCSNFEGHKEQLGEGAVYFNPLEIDEIYEALIKILNTDFRKSILDIANKEKQTSKYSEDKIIITLEQHFKEINKYRKFWKH